MEISITKEAREELNHMNIDESIKKQIEKELDEIDKAKKDGTSAKSYISKIMEMSGKFWEVGGSFISKIIALKDIL